jgi:epoxyqueuosine reductase
MSMDTLPARLDGFGFRARTVRVDRLRDLAGALDSQHARGLFDDGFYEERLTEFDAASPQNLPAARSIVIAAYADPHVRFTFEWKGEQVPVIVPATYLHWQRKDERVRKALNALIAADDSSLVAARVPEKLLAVRSGLAQYGLNNIAYAEGMGSLFRLTAFFSDLPCEKGTWAEPVLMERCASCRACVGACPTGAIDPERTLLHAERCIVFWNEKPKDVPLPSWLAGEWHNALVGCLHCQRLCPENAGLSDEYEEGMGFSETETRLLLDGTSADRLPAGLVGKLEKADLLSMLDTIPRNLGVLLARRERGT